MTEALIRGEWVKEENIHKCSNCGWLNYYGLLHNFCPRCGSDMRKTEANLYDIEEEHPNATVQILKNSITGEISVGWWDNDN